MESCQTSQNPIEVKDYNRNVLSEDNKIFNDNTSENKIIENASQSSLKNKVLLTSLLSNESDHKNEIVKSPSASLILSESEMKEVEKAYQVADKLQSVKIRKIDPTRFLHSLPDSAYPQLPKLKKYTTVYTSRTLFPIDNNDDIKENSSKFHEEKLKNENDVNNNDDYMTEFQNININNTEEHPLKKDDNNTLMSNQINDDINKNNDNSLNSEQIKRSEEDKIDIDKTYKNLMPKFTDMVKVKKINFPMIMDILNGKRTNTLYERHASIIEKLVKIIEESMKEEYVSWLIDIINTLRKKILQGGLILVKPLINLIESIKIYEFLNQNSNPIENKKIKLLNTILKTISIPNYPELCYCILNTISKFAKQNISDKPIPPINPPVLCKQLSQNTLNIYFNLYYFNQSPKSLYIISHSNVIKYLLNSSYFSENSEVQLQLLLTLKFLLHSDELCDKFLNCDGMNLLCKYTNSMTNIKNYYNISNKNSINNKKINELPMTPHQSVGDLIVNDNEFIDYNNKNSSSSNSNMCSASNTINNLNGTISEHNENNSLSVTTTESMNINKMKNIKLNYDAIYTVIEILIYVVDTKKRNDAIIQVSHKESMFYLKCIYEQICLSVKREIHKNIRNDLVTFFSRILENTSKTSNKLSSIFYKINLTNSIYNELKKPDPVFVNKIIPIDYEYKQILFNIIGYLCFSNENIELLSDLGFLEYSFKYLTFEDSEYIKSLNVMQLKQIQLQILDILSYMLQDKMIKKKWFKCEGNMKIYNYLPEAIFNESGLTDGCNIISSVVGLIPSTLKVLLNISQLGLYMKSHLGSLGIFKTLIDILNNNTFDDEVIQLGLMICSSLCHDCIQNKDIFNKEGGIKMLTKKLKYQNPNKSSQHIILLSTIDCIWKSICGCKKSEFKFFENEGLKLLLNIIENDKEIRNQAMGCLLDLMENINARSYLLLWRSEKNSNIGIEQLLINLWIEIENNLGVNKIGGNIISNTRSPLQPDNFIKDNYRLKANIQLNKSCVINDMKDDFRVKIFSMFEILGFNSFDATLTIDQKIYLEYIKKYLDFKIGETWDEIIDELNIQGIRPITPDNDYIMAIHRSLNKKGENVQKFQQELVKMKNKLQKTENNYFMEELQQIERVKYESLKREKYQTKIKQAFKSQNK
ncbi:hypothetical protein H8356DRAFT_1677701 [Neocallimastix lanati (nom. inval.)]|jgi:hypothetical protein|nr:hypothetical protein H8356DRAFT_1677701 [Neocallimastix sp. JGI-2020a]